MRKKTDNYLDNEAMKMGYELMLQDVSDQLAAGMQTETIKPLLIDRKKHIEQRLEELK